jgi:hypothetical protein
MFGIPVPVQKVNSAQKRATTGRVGGTSAGIVCFSGRLRGGKNTTATASNAKNAGNDAKSKNNADVGKDKASPLFGGYRYINTCINIFIYIHTYIHTYIYIYIYI